MHVLGFTGMARVNVCAGHLGGGHETGPIKRTLEDAHEQVREVYAMIGPTSRTHRRARNETFCC